jgi:hypothetical protein
VWFQKRKGRRSDQARWAKVKCDSLRVTDNGNRALFYEARPPIGRSVGEAPDELLVASSYASAETERSTLVE